MRQGIRVIRLKGVWTQPRDGRKFYRTRKGGKLVLIPLPDLPTDHPDFIAAWAEAARTQKAPDKPAAGTIESLWNAALASDAARDWSDGYRQMIERQKALICRQAGKAPVAGLREQHIRKNVAEAVNPGARLKAWRWWTGWAVERGYLSTDLAKNIKPPKRAKSDGHPVWTDAQIAAFRARWPIGTVARAAMELMLFVGCRVSDAVSIGPQHVGRDGVLAYTQQKTKARAFVPWSCPLPEYAAHLVADRQMMMDALAPISSRLLFLPKEGELPRSKKALSTLMQDACKAAGIPVSAHGLRKYRAADLADHGATPHQMNAWTGHQTLSETDLYTRSMDRRRAVTGIQEGKRGKG